MLVAIEGIDGTGKGTQAQMLSRRARDLGFTTQLFSFPQYSSSFFGREIGHYLNGGFGDLHAVHPKMAALLYAGDRLEARAAIIQHLAQNSIVVCDRYVASNQAHQGAKLPRDSRPAFAAWVESLEFDVYDLPRPDVVFFLDMPPEVAAGLVRKKDTRSYTDRVADIHEEDDAYLYEVYMTYADIGSNRDWVRVTCLEDGRLRSAEDIHQEIWNELNRRFARTMRLPQPHFLS